MELQQSRRSIVRRRRFRTACLCLLSGLMGGCAFINVSLFEGIKPLEETVLTGKGEGKVLLISVGGVLVHGRLPSPPRLPIGRDEPPPLLSQIKEQLKQAEQDTQIKAVVLRINSPGGSVTASDILYHELMEFKRKTGARLVASFLDVGASGAYYAALAADKIVAHPTSVTGSIGVLVLRFNVQGLLEKIGVEATTVQSGSKKDMGLPFRPLSPDERAILQEMTGDLHERFVALVAARRSGLDLERVRALADGRVFTAQKAHDLGLIDAVGYTEDAIELAKKEAGLTEARVIAYRRPGAYLNNIYSATAELGQDAGLGALFWNSGPTFFYLWMP